MISAERFQADGYHWQVYKNKTDDGYTALAKAFPFVHFAKPLYEPYGDRLYFQFGATADEAYTRLRLDLGLEMEWE